MKISVVVPAFDEAKRLSRTLRHINRAFEAIEYDDRSWEVIVCDNNSADGTSYIASTLEAKVIFEPVNQISRARNAGASVASGEWLLFIDADTFPPPALMSDVSAVINSGKYVGCGTTVSVEGGTIFNKLRMERLNPLFRLFNFCGGAFLLCRHDAFRSLGGFSTGLYAFEDIEFVLRLKKYGRSIGKTFVTLHRHPVVTSGRKGEYQLSGIFRLLVSNILALVLFALHFVLPRKWVGWLGANLLSYWYKSIR